MAIHMKMILLSLVMLLIAFEPAFSGKILKKLDKELKKMGLQKLQNFLADIGTNADEIDSNKAHIDNIAVDVGTNAVDIATNADEIDSNKVHIDNNAADIDTLKTNGSGSVWFDAWRTSSFSASNTCNGNGDGQCTWTTITYQNVRESSNSGAMDIGTGMFTAPLAGTYQFIIQVAKDKGVCGDVRILLDGKEMSWLIDCGATDNSNMATITGTVITKMQPGQKVWAKTFANLRWFSIHFTGVLITPE